jgi:hypothetical protein
VKYENAKAQIIDDRINYELEKLKAPYFNVDPSQNCQIITDGYVECSIILKLLGLYSFSVHFEETKLDH